MTYLTHHDPVSPGQCFRHHMTAPGIFRLPGAHNGQAALQAKAAGFEGLYLSGAAMSASMGLPDLGLMTIDDVTFFLRQLTVSGLPILADADTGFGEALNVMTMVRRFEAAGAGAIQLEDQILPKKCGHLSDKRLATPADMAAKIAAAARARRDMVIIARTDAAASEGLEGAVARAKTYIEAGADAIFPEALTDIEMMKAFAAALPNVPLLANMTEFGRSPALTGAALEQLGYAMVIWPVSSLRVANKAQEALYASLREHDTTEQMLPQMQTRAELYETIGYFDYEALDASIQRSSIPGVV